MRKTINLEGVTRGDALLARAAELGKARGNRPARPVPLDDILAPTVVTVEELAQITRLAQITIRRAIQSGKLKAASGGGRSGYRISRADAEAWWRSRGGGALFGDVANIRPIDTTRQRLATLDAFKPATGTQTSGTVLDLSSDRGDVYGYTEREETAS